MGFLPHELASQPFLKQSALRLGIAVDDGAFAQLIFQIMKLQLHHYYLG
jgi:hypothetical protein